MAEQRFQDIDSNLDYSHNADPQMVIHLLEVKVEKQRNRINNLERSNRLLTVKLDKISRDCACNLSDAVRFRRQVLELEEKLKDSERKRVEAENWNKVYEQESVAFKSRMKAGQQAVERLRKEQR